MKKFKKRMSKKGGTKTAASAAGRRAAHSRIATEAKAYAQHQKMPGYSFRPSGTSPRRVQAFFLYLTDICELNDEQSEELKKLTTVTHELDYNLIEEKIREFVSEEDLPREVKFMHRAYTDFPHNPKFNEYMRKVTPTPGPSVMNRLSKSIGNSARLVRNSARSAVVSLGRAARNKVHNTVMKQSRRLHTLALGPS